MYQKLDEIKVLRDPVHGYIHIEYQVIWDCLNSKEFQRLRRIKQLGTAYLVYHTAEHSRFAHSLGVYEIVRRMVSENFSIAKSLTEEEKIAVMLAGLLHDIGHGPYSHAFESVCDIPHEQFTINILTQASDICHILQKCSLGLEQKVASIINKTHPNQVLSQMISGQLDADRMDYLLRDAYFTGTKYGEFDLERILRTLRISKGKLVVKYSGIHSVEDYIMARYHMYWQVYYHPVARSAEMILVNIFKRLKYLVQEDSSFKQQLGVFKPFILHQEITNEEHYLMDEVSCNYIFEQLIHHDDPILSDLARRLINRDLFEYCDYFSEDQYLKLQRKLSRYNYDPKYYLTKDAVNQRPYQPYRYKKNAIWILMPNGRIKEMSKASVIVDSLLNTDNINDHKLFYPNLD